MTALATHKERAPATWEAFAACRDGDGEALFERLCALDRTVGERRREVAVSSDGPSHASSDVDVLLAGGGLSLLFAQYLASRGLTVAVVDRARIGQVHRGWNASRRELAALSAAGIVTEAELTALIETTYRDGICRWHGGGTQHVRDVLDCAVDAPALMRNVRARCEELRVELVDFDPLVEISVGKGAVVARLSSGRTLAARVLLDGTGAASPFSVPDLLCPTVGGVLDGLTKGDAPDELDPELGEILVTTEGVEEGRQHIWEGFPGRQGLTAYLFHYAEPHELGPSPLLSLFERFFKVRSRYKRGHAELVRPTFGVIPGHTRLRSSSVAPMQRVLLVGDAAARHSPLTFCGFGSMIRSVAPVGDALIECLDRDRLMPRDLERAFPEPPSLPLLGALSLMLTARGVRATHGDVNGLLDAAFRVLAEQGQARFSAFLRDEGTALEVVAFLAKTSARRRSVYREVLDALGPSVLARWTGNLARAVLS